MNRYYIVLPVVLMAIFIYFERGASKEAAILEQQKIEAKVQAEAKKEAEKKALEEKARIDSEKRNADRIAEEEKLKKKKKDEFDAKIQKMRDDVKKYTDDVELNNKLVAVLEKDLAAKRDQRERENRAVFDLAKKVELSKKLRRDAELEVQRFTEMLSRKASESVLTKMPVIATAANADK